MPRLSNDMHSDSPKDSYWAWQDATSTSDVAAQAALRNNRFDVVKKFRANERGDIGRDMMIASG